MPASRNLRPLPALCALAASLLIGGALAHEATAQDVAPAAPPPDAEAPTAEPADEPTAEPAGIPAGLTPPELVSSVEAEYPPDAWDDEIEADVVLQIDVSAEGEVGNITPVRVLYYWYDENGDLQEEEGDVDDDSLGFIRSAVEAMSGYRFRPAILADDDNPDGRPIPVQLTWRIGFVVEQQDERTVELDEAFESDDPADADRVLPDGPVNLRGQVLERGRRRTLAGMRVQAYREPDGPRIDTLTDDDGRFTFRGLPAGTWLIVIDEAGFLPLEVNEQVTREDLVDVVYRVEREYFDEYRSQTVEAPPAREVTRRRLEVQEIQRIPGNNNDAIRVVQNLPGVARAAFSGGDIIVRGSEPNDSAFFIDGMPIPTLYHFGGLRAVVPSELLQDLNFYPGNFGVRYGRATAGVLEVTTTHRQAEEWSGHIDANLFDTGVFFQGPIGDRVTVQFGARRSYIDGVLAAASAVIPVQFTVAPRYYDYQARVIWQINDTNTASLMLFGSDDLVDLVLRDQSGLDPGIRGGFRSISNFHNALLRWDTRISDTLTNEVRFLAGIQGFGASAGQDFYLDLALRNFAFRDELAWRASDTVTLRTGVDIRATPGTLGVRLPRPPREGEAGVDFAAAPVVEAEQDFRIYTPGIYAELDLQPNESLQIIPGVRADYFRGRGWSVDGRLGARYSVSDLVTLKGAVGSYSRAPDPDETSRVFGNPDLALERALQYSLGFELDLTEFLEFDVEVFYKDLRRLVSRSDGVLEREGEAFPEVYNNGGRGRVYGAEFFLRHQLANNFFGWLTYTISRSERLDSGADAWRLFDSDQTHILALIGSYNLPRNWSVGARYRLISGNPFTPLIGSTFDVDNDTYIRVAGPPNSDRNRLFHQLDVRVDKRWIFDRWTLNAYLDLQNAYNRMNPEGFRYSYDYSETDIVTGLPIIPAFGIRAEF